jgi:hypothetical protein
MRPAPRGLRRIVPGSLVLSLTILGCVDLGEVQQFAKSSQDVGKQFSPMADAASAACARSAELFIPVPGQNVTPPDCSIYPKINPELEKINDALFAYIASLGKLAAADLSKVPGGLDKVADNLKAGDPNISSAAQDQAKAAAGLASAITTLVTNGYRENVLKKIIGNSDDAVAKTTDFLSGYAADKMRQSFSDELNFEKSFCDAKKSTEEPLATTILLDRCERAEASIQKQLDAVKAYQAAMATIKDAHHKLYLSRTHWDTKQLITDLGPNVVSLNNAAISIDKAF